MATAIPSHCARGAQSQALGEAGGERPDKGRGRPGEGRTAEWEEKHAPAREQRMHITAIKASAMLSQVHATPNILTCLLYTSPSPRD
eukprot:5672199-Alexandrium_andersonii.AAC.1